MMCLTSWYSWCRLANVATFIALTNVCTRHHMTEWILWHKLSRYCTFRFPWSYWMILPFALEQATESLNQKSINSTVLQLLLTLSWSIQHNHTSTTTIRAQHLWYKGNRKLRNKKKQDISLIQQLIHNAPGCEISKRNTCSTQTQPFHPLSATDAVHPALAYMLLKIVPGSSG